MELLRIDDVQELIRYRGGPCVSAMFPTIRGNAEVAQNLVRFKNVLGRAKVVLREQGYSDMDIDKFFERVKPLLDDNLFWQEQSAAFAMFISTKFYKTFRIPRKVSEAVTVRDRFTCKPLLPLFFDDGRFYILAMSQNKVRLLQGSRDSVRQIETKDVPESIDELMKQYTEERHIEWHTQLPKQTVGRRQAYFHGQGTASLHSEDKILQYMYAIDKGIHPILKDEYAPLIFAGVDYLFPMYQEANTYKNLLNESIMGNPDRVRDDELHQKALKLMEPVYITIQENALAKFYQFAGTGHTTTKPESIVVWAADGGIEALLVARGAKLLGKFDPKKRTVELHEKQQADSEDLLDFVESEVFATGGRIVEIAPEQMPAKVQAAAILRSAPGVIPDVY